MATHKLQFNSSTNQTTPAGWVDCAGDVSIGVKVADIEGTGISFELLSAGGSSLVSGVLTSQEHHLIPEDVWDRGWATPSFGSFDARFAGMTPGQTGTLEFFGRGGTAGRHRVIDYDGNSYQNNEADPPSAPTSIPYTADGSGNVDFTLNYASTNALYAGLILTVGAAAPSVTITDPIIPGAATTFSASGFNDPLTGARITDASGNVKEITLASQTSVSAPALGTQDYCQFGTVTIEVYNATESATTSATFDPPAAYTHLVTLPATPSNLTNTGYLFNWSPDNGYEGVQVISEFEIDANGNIVLAPADGVYTLYAIDPADGEMQGFTVTIQDGAPVWTAKRFRARRLRARPITATKLRAR